MKRILLFLCTAVLLFAGCDFAARERELERRKAELGLKERELVQREHSLQMREQELEKRARELDSTKADSTFAYHEQLPGTWQVEMSCIETTCTGSAVGDTKTERWVISYQRKLIIARVVEKEKLTRVYTGYFTDNQLELTYQDYTVAPENATMMTVRLKETVPGQMEGQRVIDRAGGCRVIYSIRMTKQ